MFQLSKNENKNLLEDRYEIATIKRFKMEAIVIETIIKIFVVLAVLDF